MPIPMSIGVGVMISMAGMLAGALALAAVIHKGKMSPDAMGYGVLAVLMISSVFGSLIACTRVSGKRLIVGAVTSAVYLLVLLCMTALFFGGRYQGVAVTALVVLGGGIISALLTTRHGKGTGKKHKKHRYG